MTWSRTATMPIFPDLQLLPRQGTLPYLSIIKLSITLCINRVSRQLLPALYLSVFSFTISNLVLPPSVLVFSEDMCRLCNHNERRKRHCWKIDNPTPAKSLLNSPFVLATLGNFESGWDEKEKMHAKWVNLCWWGCLLGVRYVTCG